MIKENLEGSFPGEGGQIDGWGGGGQLEVASDGRATDPFEGAAQDQFQGVSLNLGSGKIVAQVVENGLSDIRGEGPLLVACPGSRFFQGDD
jgi:hypothetical protein